MDDIDEIEHTEGLQFMIHYQADANAAVQSVANINAIKGAVGGAIGGLFAKKKQDNQSPTTGGAGQTKAKASSKIEKSELFESKHVKSIIETFQNVLLLIEEQERDINEFIGEREGLSDDESDDEDVTIPPRK